MIHSAVCALGILSPASVQCGHAIAAASTSAIGGPSNGGNERSGRRHREEYLTEVEYINPSANISTLLSSVHRLASISLPIENLHPMTVATFGSRTKHTYGRGRDCNMPKKDDDAMVYK